MKKILHAHSNQKILVCLFIITVIGGIMRLYNLNWDNGHYLHPDERLYVNASNITLPSSIQDFFVPTSPLNPNMFYYGSFPLYLYKSVSTFVLPFWNFLFVSRFISALFSIGTIPLIYFLARQMFTKKISLIAAFVFTFSSGSIQHAHFNTTESILIFLLTLITFLSIYTVKQKKYFIFIALGICVGISYATKIVGLTFIFFPLLSFFILLIKNKKIKKTILFFFLFIAISLFFGFLFAPYQIIDYQNFSKEQSYMQGVTYGIYKPPFVIIYNNTLPYIYQVLSILPFTFGFISLPFALIGLILLINSLRKNISKNYLFLFVIIFPIMYFLWSGLWYVKFSRYYLLLFPFLTLWSAYTLSHLRKPILFFLLFCIAINGLLFTKIYFQPHTRIQASRWIYDHIPNNSILAGEHWDDNLPLPINNLTKSFVLKQLPVYDNDTDNKINQLSQILSKSDYIIFSSRRVFQSILNNTSQYPKTSKFYQLLFNNALGYQHVQSFTNYPFFLPDDVADESFQSYDHPPILIYKNNDKKSADEIKKLINEH